MKNRKLFALLLLVATLGIAGCTPTSSSSSSEPASSTTDPSSATSADPSTEVPSSEAPSSEVPSSEVPSSEVPSSEDPSSENPSSEDPSSEDPSSDPEPDELVASVVITRGAETEALLSGSESSGAYKVTIELENIPEGLTADDYDYSWPIKNAMVDFHAIATESAKNVYEMVVLNAGVVNIEVPISRLGEVVVTAKEAFTITVDQSRYTTISTASAFIELITRGGTITDRYMLGANIDLGGYVHDGKAVNATFNGVLDGNGYSVSNFTEKPSLNDQGFGVDGGLFAMMPSAVVRNIHVIGNIYATGGWTGLLAKELGGQTVVINSVFEATDLTPLDGVEWTWQRTGVIAGFLRGRVENVVSVKYSDNNRMISTLPYSAGNRSNPDSMATMNNVYSNVGQLDLVVPFAPDPSWSSPAVVSNLKIGLGDFSESKAIDFDLDPAIFTLEDGKMPVLKHFGEEPSVLAPSVKLVASKKSIELVEEASLTITATLENSAEVAVWSAEVDDEEILSVAVLENVVTVTPLKVGVAVVTVKATVDSEEYSASVEITVKEASGEEPGEYEIPEKAVLISSAAEFKTFFNGSAANMNANAALTADIDLDGITMAMGMAGEYNGIFEGQGYTVSGYTGTQSLFNILSSSAEVRNLHLELVNTASGFAPITFMNNGKIINCETDITLKTAVNTYGGIALAGSGKYIDCHVTWHFEEGSEQTNTIYPICQNDADKDISNCTYSIVGPGAGKFITGNSAITLI